MKVCIQRIIVSKIDKVFYFFYNSFHSRKPVAETPILLVPFFLYLLQIVNIYLKVEKEN